MLAHLEKTRKQLLRMKVSEEERENRHQTLKRRHEELKKQFSLLKQEASAAKNQSSDLSAKNSLLKEQVDALRSSLVGGNFEQVSGIPIETKSDDGAWDRYLKRRRSIWKYPMRLDVLRQHEPKPIEEQVLPDISPPGAPKNWPLVSIVTPSFQQAAFIERTMASVLSQDYPRLEYRVIDGGSTDASVTAIEKVAERLAGWESRPDNGPASAINRGFEQSHGEIMSWLNSDDLLMPGAVRRVAAWFDQHPEVDVIYGNRIIIDERDRQVGRWVLPPHDDEALLWVDYIPQETLFWRRSLWERIGGRIDESFQFAFDWDLLLRFQKAGARMVRVPWFLGCFRVHDAQKTSAVYSSLGVAEITRIRQRELGPSWRGLRLDRQAIRFQERAIWHDRLLRLGIRLSAFLPTAPRPLSISSIAPALPRPSLIKRRFCTYFDLQYAAAGIAMLHSLQRHSPGAEVTVLCLEEALKSVLQAEFGSELNLMLMSELDAAQPTLASVPAHDEPWEHYAMIKPFFIDCLLSRLPDDEILTFIDADTFLFADPGPLFAELDTGSVAISPHRFNEQTQILSQYGAYNAGFSLWRQDKTARRIVKEWRDECASWCRNYPEPDGRFMDQGYLTKWPERYSGVVVLSHPGENLAPWNVGSHQLTFDGSRVRVDGCLLILFHFSGILLGSDGRWRTYYNNPAVAQRLVLDRIFRPYLETVNAISERLRERHGVDGRGSVRALNQHASLLELQPYLMPEATPYESS